MVVDFAVEQVLNAWLLLQCLVICIGIPLVVPCLIGNLVDVLSGVFECILNAEQLLGLWMHAVVLEDSRGVTVIDHDEDV